jgi:hypothetical protein
MSRTLLLTFLARAAPVFSPQQAEAHIALLNCELSALESTVDMQDATPTPASALRVQFACH